MAMSRIISTRHATQRYTIPIPYHVITCHVMPCHAIPCHVIACHSMLCHVMHAMPFNGTTGQTMPCQVYQTVYQGTLCSLRATTELDCLTFLANTECSKFLVFRLFQLEYCVWLVTYAWIIKGPAEWVSENAFSMNTIIFFVRETVWCKRACWF